MTLQLVPKPATPCAADALPCVPDGPRGVADATPTMAGTPFQLPRGINGSPIVAVPAAAPRLAPASVEPTRGRMRRPPPKPAHIRGWPKAERPRERLIELGAQALSEAELLALLLGSGTKGRSAVAVARSLLQQFGGLREMMSVTSWPLWKSQRGIGKARFAALMGALEIARRQAKAVLRETSALTSPEMTRRFLLAQLRDRPYEVFCCLFLDNRHRMLAFEEVFRGTIDGASVHPREIVRQVLAHNAASVIVAHNHPSGVPEPSVADEAVTRRLRQALALIDVRLLDHVVVGDGKCYSFAEHGLL